MDDKELTYQQAQGGIARKHYEITSQQLSLAGYFGEKPNYDIDWDKLSDTARACWLEDAAQTLAKFFTPKERRSGRRGVIRR